jgi:hypothetical protein
VRFVVVLVLDKVSDYLALGRPHPLLQLIVVEANPVLMQSVAEGGQNFPWSSMIVPAMSKTTSLMITMVRHFTGSIQISQSSH